MHSNIYQIGLKPFDKEDWREPDYYYENSDDFADYIGDRVDNEQDREEEIVSLANVIKDVFAYAGNGMFVYMGKAALNDFKEKWDAAIKQAVNELNPDNMTKEMRLFRLRCLTEETHLESSFRVDIDDNGYANAIADLFVWAESNLTLGDKFYVGAVIDYHF